MTKPTKLTKDSREVLAKVGELAYHINRLSPNEMRSLMHELERIKYSLVVSGEDAEIGGVDVSLSETDLHDGVRVYLGSLDVEWLNDEEIAEKFG